MKANILTLHLRSPERTSRMAHQQEPCTPSGNKLVQFFYKIASPVYGLFPWGSRNTNEGEDLQHSPESCKDDSPQRDLCLEEGIHTSTPVGDLSLELLPEVSIDDGPSLRPIPFISNLGSDTSDDSKYVSPTSSQEDLSLDKPFFHMSHLPGFESSDVSTDRSVTCHLQDLSLEKAIVPKSPCVSLEPVSLSESDDCEEPSFPT